MSSFRAVNSAHDSSTEDIKPVVTSDPARPTDEPVEPQQDEQPDSHNDIQSSSTSTKRGSGRGRATPRPRAVQRRTAAQRAEYAAAEAARAAERDVPETTTRPSRGRGRGRGAAVVGRGGAAAVTPGTGLFSSGTGQRVERRSVVDTGRSEAIDGFSGGQTKALSSVDALRELPGVDAQTGNSSRGGGGSNRGGGGGGGGGSGGAGGRGRRDDVMYQADEIEDDPDEAPRRDIERIYISDDEDGDAIISGSRRGKRRQSSTKEKKKIFTGLRPVRAAKTVVEDQNKSKGSTMKSKSKKMGSESAIVDEPEEPVEMEVEDGLESGPTVPSHGPETAKKPDRRRASSRSKPKEPAGLNETAEEKAERQRYKNDIERLHDELTRPPTDTSSDDADSKDVQAQNIFNQARDRMFLFQLPPLVPFLRDENYVPPSQPVTEDTVKVKREPGSTASTTSAKDGDKAKQIGLPDILTAPATASQRLPNGKVGKLNVHKSGKVTLDWGGIDMEVRYGTEVDFLQDVVRVETLKSEPADAEDKSDEMDIDGRPRPRTFALGQVKSKLVCVPDWTKLYA